LRVVFREAGSLLNLVDAYGCGYILVVKRTRCPRGIIDICEDAAIENDRGTDVQGEDVCYLESVDDIGILISELGPLNREVMLGRELRRVKIAEHDDEAHCAISGIEDLYRNPASVREVKANHEPLGADDHAHVRPGWRLDEQLDVWPPVVGGGEHGRMSFDAERERDAQNRRLHFGDFSQQMIDEIAFCELLTDRVRARHDLD